MAELSRRGLLAGMIAACAAPAIIRTPGLIMPVKPILPSVNISHEYNAYSRSFLVRGTAEYNGSRYGIGYILPMSFIAERTVEQLSEHRVAMNARMVKTLNMAMRGYDTSFWLKQ